MAAFFGCVLRGVLVVPLDASGSAEFAARVIADVRAAMVVGDGALLRRLEAGAPSLRLEDLGASLPAQAEYGVSEAVESDSAFQIVFTSGTTGDPKGIVHTHRNVLASLSAIEAEIVKYRRWERLVHPLGLLHTLPLSHVFGQFMGLWIPALLGGVLHFTDAVDPSRLVYLAKRERISVLVAVPRVLGLLRTYLLQGDPQLDGMLGGAEKLPAWRRWWRFRALHRRFGLKFWAVISGGAAVPEELERFWNGLGFALIQGYGMTETAALVTLNHPFRVGRGTLGKTLPGREVRLSEAGEILVRGDVVSRATWQRGRLRQRSDEWLATGDLAERSATGELRFVGRSGDAIVTAAGLNVHPADLEAALMAQAEMRKCVVVPCGFGSGMEPVAVVLFGGSDEALESARMRANAGLAEHQKIRRILRWPQLEFPYTSSGKLLRRQVAAWACVIFEHQARGEPGTDDGEDLLIGLIAEITGERAEGRAGAGDARRLAEDLHLDSLGRVQLASAIEQRTGLTVDDEAMARAETLGDLRRLLEGAGLGEAGERHGMDSKQSVVQSSQEQANLAETRISSGNDKQPAAREPMVYPRWPWSWPVRAMRRAFVQLVMRPLVRLLAAPRVVRAGTLPDGPMLIVANHVTAYDAALLLYALPVEMSGEVAIAMSGEMLNDFRHARGQGSWFLNLAGPLAYGLITALFNVFPLPRSRGFARSFLHAGEALDRGYSVLVFPEGTRSRSGAAGPFRAGIGLLAHQAQAPVVPVALLGLGGGRGQRWIRSGRLEVRVGAAIPYHREMSAAEYTARLEAEVRRLGA